MDGHKNIAIASVLNKCNFEAYNFEKPKPMIFLTLIFTTQ